MNIDSLRSELNRLWDSANQEADDLRDPMLASERVLSAYYSLSPEEQDIADHVLAEWVLANDDAKRYDALVLIRQLRVGTATPALRSLSVRLASSDKPGASFERERVEDLISELGD